MVSLLFSLGYTYTQRPKTRELLSYFTRKQAKVSNKTRAVLIATKRTSAPFYAVFPYAGMPNFPGNEHLKKLIKTLQVRRQRHCSIAIKLCPKI